jgi:biopolymer transport protein ExbD
MSYSIVRINSKGSFSIELPGPKGGHEPITLIDPPPAAATRDIEKFLSSYQHTLVVIYFDYRSTAGHFRKLWNILDTAGIKHYALVTRISDDPKDCQRTGLLSFVIPPKAWRTPSKI